MAERVEQKHYYGVANGKINWNIYPPGNFVTSIPTRYQKYYFKGFLI